MRILLWALSAMYMLPAPSKVTLEGCRRFADVAGTPSCNEVQARKTPATVVTFPGIRTPNPPNPVPDKYVVPRTLLLLSNKTTAPMRAPGAAGVKVTDCEQVWLTARLAEGQVDAPPPTVKSRPLTPSVSTCTLLTVPATRAVTLTGVVIDVPMGWVPKTDCPRAPTAVSSRTGKTSIPPRLRRGLSAVPVLRSLRQHDPSSCAALAAETTGFSKQLPCSLGLKTSAGRLLMAVFMRFSELQLRSFWRAVRGPHERRRS